MKQSPYLTVVIPIRNEEQFITDTLRALVSQDYPRDRYELIVVDGQSTDRTRETVEGFMHAEPDASIRLLVNSGRWSSRGRNIGVRAAKGSVIAVIDGHVHVPSANLFSSIERVKESNQALALARPAPLTVPGLDAGVGRWVALARKSWLAHSQRSHIYRYSRGFVDPMSSGFAYDRSVFEEVGYFDESFDAAEDVEFHYRLKRAGILAFTAPELTIFSYPRTSLRGLLRQMIRYGIGRARLVRKHPDAFAMESLVPPSVLVLSFLSGVALLLLPWLPKPALTVLALFSAYAIPVTLSGFNIARKERMPLHFWIPSLAIWLTHLGLGWGLVSHVFLPTRCLFRSRGKACWEADSQ